MHQEQAEPSELSFEFCDPGPFGVLLELLSYPCLFSSRGSHCLDVPVGFPRPQPRGPPPRTRPIEPIRKAHRSGFAWALDPLSQGVRVPNEKEGRPLG
eukprot:scaffold282_cov345-Pavlova_lutheri.AAC.21